MGTLKQAVDRVAAAKTAIGTAITAKGGTVAAGDGLEEFAAEIAKIPSGIGIYRLALSGTGISDVNVYYAFFNNQFHVFGYFQSTGASGTYYGYFKEKSLAELGVPAISVNLPCYCINPFNYASYGNIVYSDVTSIILNIPRIDNGRMNVYGVANWG